MTKRHWEKLEEPQIIELDSHLAFVLATEVDYTDLKIGIIFFKGKHYNYEDGDVVFENEYIELQYSISQDGYLSMDETGKYID